MRAGGTPVMLPLTDDADILAQCAERFDAFLFTGGPDVGPMVGAVASATGRSEVLSPERDRMESILLPAAMAWDSRFWASAAAFSSSTRHWAARCGRICQASIRAISNTI